VAGIIWGMVKVLDFGFVDLIDSMPAVPDPITPDWGPGDARIVQSARVSYAGKSKGVAQDRKLLSYLWKNRHTSPFEQVQFTFHVKAPLFIIRQWQRHRTWSYNEVSARYTTLPEECYVPARDRMQGQSADNKQCSAGLLSDEAASMCDNLLRYGYDRALSTYRYLIANGLSRELARCVLPVGIYTEMYASVDLRNLLHFLSLRDHGHAQHEIQVYAKAIRQLIAPVVPATMAIVAEGG